MRSQWQSRALASLVAAAFLFGAISIFYRQFASGEVYPEFSSMRTDPRGTKLLYDSLSRLPGITVGRNFVPVEFLPQQGIVFLLVGINPLSVNWNEGLVLRTAESVAARGNRVVLGMHLNTDGHDWNQQEFDRREQPQNRNAKKAPPSEPQLKSLWKVKLKLDPDAKQPHRLYFGEADGWAVREQTNDKIIAIERPFGKGSVVLLAESVDFTNDSVVRLGRLPQVCDALGDYRRIVFDEQHLGIAESGSIVEMARRFRLTGLALGLAICAALFIWKNASSFPPPVSRRETGRLWGRTSHAGLLALLKRHIAPAELAAVCWRQWLSANRGHVTPEIQRQAETILAGAGGRPVEATREIQALLREKGEL
jgi:hypothetical protein